MIVNRLPWSLDGVVGNLIEFGDPDEASSVSQDFTDQLPKQFDAVGSPSEENIRRARISVLVEHQVEGDQWSVCWTKGEVVFNQDDQPIGVAVDDRFFSKDGQIVQKGT